LKNNLPFFSHDNDARNHPKFKALRARYGWAGYGLFWALNEMIADAEECQLDLRRPVIKAGFASDLGLSDSEFEDFVDFLADSEQCGLIKYEDGIVTTDRTQKAYSLVRKKRNRAQKDYVDRKRDSDSRNADSDVRIDTKQSKANSIDDDGDSQNFSDDRNANSDDRKPPSFTAADLRAALAKSAPRDLTISDKLLEDLTARLKAAGLGLGYVTWYGDYVRRQSNLQNRGGYFRAHFGELVDRYKAAQEKQAAPKPHEQEAPAKPEDIEKAFAGLPWRRSKSDQKNRDGPKELPTF
jgi:hypothetical protein